MVMRGMLDHTVDNIRKLDSKETNLLATVPGQPQFIHAVVVAAKTKTYLARRSSRNKRRCDFDV